jgi:hypothetical protein
MTTAIKQLRAQAAKYSVNVYQQGSNWICVSGVTDRYEDALPYYLDTERKALEYCIERALNNSSLVAVFATQK